MVPFIAWASWGLIVGLPLYGIRRGSASIFSFGMCVLLASVITLAAAPPLAEAFPLGHHLLVAQGLWRLMLFLPLFIAAFPLGAVLHRFFIFTFDPYDWVVGLLLALLISLFVVRTILSSSLLFYLHQPEFDTLNMFFLTRHLVALDSWHALLAWMNSLHAGHEITVPPD